MAIHVVLSCNLYDHTLGFLKLHKRSNGNENHQSGKSASKQELVVCRYFPSGADLHLSVSRLVLEVRLHVARPETSAVRGLPPHRDSNGLDCRFRPAARVVAIHGPE